MNLGNMYLARLESVSKGSYQPEIWVVDPTVHQQNDQGSVRFRVAADHHRHSLVSTNSDPLFFPSHDVGSFSHSGPHSSEARPMSTSTLGHIEPHQIPSDGHPSIFGDFERVPTGLQTQ